MSTSFRKTVVPFAVFALLILLIGSPVSAQTEPAAAPAAEAPASPQTDAEEPNKPGDPNAKYIYEKPSRQKFSRLYWSLGMLDLKDNESIDNFLQINECDIYKDYFFNEFEWKNVRESGRIFLGENKNKFPIRFEIIQPLFLGEYDLQSKNFEILEDYQIKETTRLEIFPNDYADVVCQDDGSGKVQQIKNYPIGVVAEFNRPLNLVSIPVSPDLAKYYIEEKMKFFKNLRSAQQNQENLYNTRDAYIFMHIKFFAYKDTYVNRDNYTMAEIMAVLEGFEVYADREKKLLLWTQDFRKKKAKPTRKPKDKKESAPAATQAVKPDDAATTEEEAVDPFSPQTPGGAIPPPAPAETPVQ